MSLNVRIESQLPKVSVHAVNYETGASRQMTQDHDTVTYEHHGEDFATTDKGALTAFYEDLILARPVPETFVTHALRDIDTLTAIALFLHRDLLKLTNTASFVHKVDAVHRFDAIGLAHTDEPTGVFLSALRRYISETGLPKRELASRVTTAVNWIHEFIEHGRSPFEAEPRGARIIDVGSHGFVVATTFGNLTDGWIDLFRAGHLRGVLSGPTDRDRRPYLIARKSPYVTLNLPIARDILNRMEAGLGEPPSWHLNGDLWLGHPGSLVLFRQVIDVLIRV